MKIYLIERNTKKFNCLKERFADEDVILVNKDFQMFMAENRVQCVVSPANSFGLMDGGYDGAITDWYGDQLQERVQKYIIENFYGEQPVGTSFIIETDIDDQYLIHTPTMQTPQPIEDPRIIYHCMRSTLIVAKKNGIKSILIPMFGGETGRIKPQVVSEMMYRAYKQFENIPERLDWEFANERKVFPVRDFRCQKDE